MLGVTLLVVVVGVNVLIIEVVDISPMELVTELVVTEPVAVPTAEVLAAPEELSTEEIVIEELAFPAAEVATAPEVIKELEVPPAVVTIAPEVIEEPTVPPAVVLITPEVVIIKTMVVASATAGLADVVTTNVFTPAANNTISVL